MAKWMTGPVNFGKKDRRPNPSREEKDLPSFQMREMIDKEGTERMYPDPGGPDFRQQTWDDFANKAGRSRGVKCEVINQDGSTADGFVGYMDRQKSKTWEQFVEKKVEKNQPMVEDIVTSRKENAVIERLNVNMDSDNDGDGHESDEEGGPGSKEVKKVLTYAEHQKIKLDRLFDKCKDGRAVFIPEMPSKIPERDVNQVRETQYNIMGSCAGAGSGEFHSFRKSRRREYARQSILKYRDIRDKKNLEWQDKVESQKESEDAKTAKKRAKRLKEKERKKQKKNVEKKKETSSEESSESEEEEQDEEKVKEKEDPYNDPLMQHNTGPAIVIAGQFSVE